MLYRVLFFFLLSVSAVVLGYDVKTYIPTNAYQYIPMVESNVSKLMPELPVKGYFESLVEVESCVSLTNKRCWSPTSTLQTKRELGKGFGQLTKAYNSDGSVRFDTVTDLSKRYAELRELNWNNIEKRPDLQVTAIVLLWKQNYKGLYSIKDPVERTAFADAAYNGGLGGVKKDRTLCGLKKGCDPQIWFANTELTCSKSTKPIYDTRSPCSINRTHVREAVKVRLTKYQQYLSKI